ncbi:hypothetical protein FA13DRAFT_1733797 [Coprinellus micaceus]|uniref:PARP catalytic domain-containing protein n=1 Tax=Coprinellus micaceus TaxID=71717 RepID=A0A4Y7T8H6_COPMI|nr:hypothetical protein FA13DRAFT_1733797 [Coprinellus micaceus]
MSTKKDSTHSPKTFNWVEGVIGGWKGHKTAPADGLHVSSWRSGKSKNEHSKGPQKGAVCIECNSKPHCHQDGKFCNCQTCGLSCSRKRQSKNPHSRSRTAAMLCVVCTARPVYKNFITCGLTCHERLCKEGGNPMVCDYCHRRPRIKGSSTCGDACRELARVACLVCKCRPENPQKSDFCSETCRRLAEGSFRILQVPRGHRTYEMVTGLFRDTWRANNAAPPTPARMWLCVGKSESMIRYKKYRNDVGNEGLLWHGTKRECGIGVITSKRCQSRSCPACNIVRSSFKVSEAKDTGAFGKGIYTSSASNKAYRTYCGADGALFLTRVARGKVRYVEDFEEVKELPADYDSVVFNRLAGKLNETVVYHDDAIRPFIFMVF